MYVVGLMSGTSSDGVDAALVNITGRGRFLKARTLAAHTLAYPRSLQQRILSASVSGTVAEICHLNALLGEWFANAALNVIRQAKLRPADIAVIGSHGQTVHHLPKGIQAPGVGAVRSTLQIAEPAVIAERTGITTIANFRPRDIAAGGQGAPLTPAAHALLLKHPRRARLIVNLGGISNVTYVPRGGMWEGVLAFDTGPANMVLDSLVARATNGRPKDESTRVSWGNCWRIRFFPADRRNPQAVKNLVPCSSTTCWAFKNSRGYRWRTCWQRAACGRPRRLGPHVGGSR